MDALLAEKMQLEQQVETLNSENVRLSEQVHVENVDVPSASLTPVFLPQLALEALEKEAILRTMNKQSKNMSKVQRGGKGPERNKDPANSLTAKPVVACVHLQPPRLSARSSPRCLRSWSWSGASGGRLKSGPTRCERVARVCVCVFSVLAHVHT